MTDIEVDKEEIAIAVILLPRKEPVLSLDSLVNRYVSFCNRILGNKGVLLSELDWFDRCYIGGS